MSYRDIMIDLETASSDGDAAIVAIGAMEFDRSMPPVEGPDAIRRYPHFYVNVDLQSSIDAGLKVSGSTLYWWLKQSEEARNQLVNPEPVTLMMALGQFTAWLARGQVGGNDALGAPYIWCHATFDEPILANAYRAAGLGDPPWKFRNCRDVRTIVDLAYGDERVPDVPDTNKHDALWDAFRQAVMVQRCWAKLNAGAAAVAAQAGREM